MTTHNIVIPTTLNEMVLTIERDAARKQFFQTNNNKYWGRDEQCRFCADYGKCDHDLVRQAYAVANINREKFTIIGDFLAYWQHDFNTRCLYGYIKEITTRTTGTAMCTSCNNFFEEKMRKGDSQYAEAPAERGLVCPVCGGMAQWDRYLDKVFAPMPKSPARVAFELSLSGEEMRVNLAMHSCCKAFVQAITFSWTFDEYNSGGCGNDKILAEAMSKYPEHADFMRRVYNMHLNRIFSGAPMHDIENGWHFYGGSLWDMRGCGNFGEPMQERNNETLARHFGISVEEAAAFDFERIDEMAAYVTENLRPKWFAEAASLRQEFARRLEIDLI